jgi:DNA polymerase
VTNAEPGGLATAPAAGSKSTSYSALVQRRRGCTVCSGVTNPSVCADGRYDADEIGPWSRWQGNLDADLMLVGQDWGDTGSFERQNGLDSVTSATNRVLRELLASVGIDVGLPPGAEGDRGRIFLTNAVLCLKEGGAQAAVQPEWFQNCGGRFLRPLIELVRPKVVVCLGQRAYDAVLGAYGMRPRTFREAVGAETADRLPTGSALVPVYHCGMRILNTHRPLEAQKQDWQRVRRALEQPRV